MTTTNPNGRCLGLGHDRCKLTEEITAGDIIMFLNTPHLVDRVEPYTSPAIGRTAGIAKARDGWGMVLEPGRCVQVA